MLEIIERLCVWMSDKYEEVFNLESIKEKLIDWQTEEKEETFITFAPLDIRRVEWLVEQVELNEKYRRQISDMNKTISEQRKQIKGKTENINKKQRYINFLKYGRRNA